MAKLGADRAAGARSFTRFVQLCPNDGPPFLDLCRVYAKAAERLGLAATTVFLNASRTQPPPSDNHYLNAADLRATRELGAKLRALAPDLGDALVLCHRYRAYWVIARSGLSPGRTIALAHEHGFLKPRRRAARLLFGRGVLFAGVSPTIAEELQRQVGEALHLPNALDLESLELRERAAARRELGLPSDGVCIGLIGRLHYKKNPELALEGFRRFLARRGDAHLGIVGDGDLRERLAARAVGLPVTFAGFVRDPKRLMRAFDAVLLTSGTQAFPNMVALEAMAAGVPVAAPRLPDAVSLLGGLGCYFDNPSAESVASALDKAVAQGTLAAGPERVRSEYSVEAVARRLRPFTDRSG